MGNRYAGDGDAGPIEAFRDAGRDTYLDVDDDGIEAGWTFPNVIDDSCWEPTDRELASMHWRVPVVMTVNATDYGKAVELLVEQLAAAGIDFELVE